VQNRQYRMRCHVPYDSYAETLSADQPMFDEDFDIDVEKNYASVRVPDFSGGRNGRFIHDFNSVSISISQNWAQILPFFCFRI